MRYDACSIDQHNIEKAFLGFLQVTVAIKDIEEGSYERSFELKDPKDASRTMAMLKVPSHFHIPFFLSNAYLLHAQHSQDILCISTLQPAQIMCLLV